MTYPQNLAPSAEELFAKLQNIAAPHSCRYTLERCHSLAPWIARIQALKEKRNAVILAHTYVHPDIVYGVADFVGDSYSLALSAKKTQADVIVFPAVRFMAETAKILNPEKIVIDPNPNGGCSLADSIDAREVDRLRQEYPEYTFVCYVNTSAEVKAACDVCVTSSNVYRVIERLPNDKIFFLPDRWMGENIQRRFAKQGIQKRVLVYDGACYVHEAIEADAIAGIRKQHPDAFVIAHPECKPSVVEKADFVGSTAEMQRFVATSASQQRPFFLLSECGVAARIAVEVPEARLVGSCTLCRYMRSNSLEAIAQALETPRPDQMVSIAPEIQFRALMTLERMFTYAE
jgi:quinolinate synthase